jgi:hypothetical protein
VFATARAYENAALMAKESGAALEAATHFEEAAKRYERLDIQKAVETLVQAAVYVILALQCIALLALPCLALVDNVGCTVVFFLLSMLIARSSCFALRAIDWRSIPTVQVVWTHSAT